MPRKPQTLVPTAPLNMRLPVTLRERLVKAAYDHNLTITQVVIKALNEYLKKTSDK